MEYHSSFEQLTLYLPELCLLIYKIWLSNDKPINIIINFFHSENLTTISYCLKIKIISYVNFHFRRHEKLVNSTSILQ